MAGKEDSKFLIPKMPQEIDILYQHLDLLYQKAFEAIGITKAKNWHPAEEAQHAKPEKATD